MGSAESALKEEENALKYAQFESDDCYIVLGVDEAASGVEIKVSTLVLCSSGPPQLLQNTLMLCL